LSSHRDPSTSDATDSDSDGPTSSRSFRDMKGKKKKDKGNEEKKKEKKKEKRREKKKRMHRNCSHSRSRSDRHHHSRRHPSISSSSSSSTNSNTSSDSNSSSSSGDSSSDSISDSDPDDRASKRHRYHRSTSSRPLVVFKSTRHGDVDDVHDGISSLRLTQPLADAFLDNVYRTSKSVHDAYEKIEFRQTRNKRECLALARVIDLIERKKYSRALESLVRRLAGVHTSDSTGDWNYSDAYELDMSKQSFVPDDFAAYAAKSVGRMSARDSKSKPTASDRRRTGIPSTSTRISNDHPATSASSMRDPTTKSASNKSNGKQRGESGSRKK